MSRRRTQADSRESPIRGVTGLDSPTEPILATTVKSKRIRPTPSGGSAVQPRRTLAALSARWMTGDSPFIALVILIPIVLRLPELLGVLHSSAVGYLAGAGVASPGYIGGYPTIDPNIGYTAQALGKQAAQQWLAGKVPWWNPYEGVGLPLAGEMQSAAFFPFTMLYLFPWGQTAAHVLLQIIGGVSTYYLLRRLRLSHTAATTGAVLFELNGVYIWLANAVFNPVAFLPLLLLGVERAFVSAQEPAPGGRWRSLLSFLTRGWKWIATALALMLLAGFPEVAFINGVLAALWVGARLFILRGWGRRLRFALSVGLGFVVGLVLAAPLLVAFAAYLPTAFVGLHGQNTGALDLPTVSLAQMIYPYIYGNIFQYSISPAVFVSWGNIGGYIGATVTFLALLGVFGRREWILRLTLISWIVLAVGRTFGAQPFAAIVNKIPLIGSVAFYRYANTSWTLAAIILVAFALDDWRGTIGDKIKALLCSAFTLSVLGIGALVFALPVINTQLMNPTISKKYLLGSIGIEWAAIIFLTIALLIGGDASASSDVERGSGASAAMNRVRLARRAVTTLRARPHAALMALVVILLSMGYAFLPSLANPRRVTMDETAIRYLQTHSGYSRFYTLGPIAPNYGSYFDIASINYNDLPISSVWVAYIHTHLDPYADPVSFLNLSRGPGLPSAADELAMRLSAYEAVGVKYVVTPPGQQPFARVPARQRPALVYQDNVMWIYELRSPAPLFSADGGQCAIQPLSWTDAMASCASAATLTFRTLTAPGWHATVNGRAESITPVDGLFQQVALPAGQSHITFWYEPAHATAALLAAGAALIALVSALLFALWEQRHASHSA